jgi:ATP-dependent RNA circularization protein (DNA/RNA ligase family)
MSENKPYSKIETVFDRDERFQVDESRLRRPIFGDIGAWAVTEKVDGTNIRIHFAWGENGQVTSQVSGKTDRASIPPQLQQHCFDLAAKATPDMAASMDEYGLSSITLYGEGYGAKIQSGGYYREDQGFILFDVMAGDRWLSEDAVTAYADALDIPRVPQLGFMSLPELVAFASRGFASELAALEPGRHAEGVVAKTREPLYDNRGERLIVKLKEKDYRPGRAKAASR